MRPLPSPLPRFLPALTGVLLAACVAGCGGGGPSAGAAASPSGSTDGSAQQICQAFSGRATAGAVITATTAEPAQGIVPEHCRIDALIPPALRFEVRVPAAWNGKLHYGGGGGFGGLITPLEGPNLAALFKGYLHVVSNSGHDASSAFDASWALNNPDALALYGQGSVPAVMDATLQFIQQAWGRQPTRAYYEGCSNGGREALVMAQRQPLRFDGIIARAPALNFTAQLASYQLNLQALAAPGAAMGLPKVQTLAHAVLQRCDADDGLADGVVSRPSTCDFQASSLRCAAGLDLGNGCLSDAQLAVVRQWASPATFVNGRYRQEGWALTGGEDQQNAWPDWLTGPVPLQYLFADGAIRFMWAANPALASNTFVPDQHPQALDAFAQQVDATDPDLSAFQAHGGKLLLWHGLSDAAVSAANSVAYFQAVQARMGSGTTQGFARLYLAPGVNHCNGGSGADSTDLLDALDAWVDQGVTPGVLPAEKHSDSGSTVLSRPLCPYPLYPRYIGPMNNPTAATQAASFRCTDPAL